MTRSVAIFIWKFYFLPRWCEHLKLPHCEGVSKLHTYNVRKASLKKKKLYPIIPVHLITSRNYVELSNSKFSLVSTVCVFQENNL